MREIKFRQPIFLNGEFHNWHYFGFILQKGLSDYIFIAPIGNDKTIKEIMELSQQFTGLQDKNKKEIYEGDIFDCIYKEDGCKHKNIIVWHISTAGFKVRSCGECDQPNVRQSFLDMQQGEIIGNIYENPELLNQTEETVN